jgi:hypothetical protein
MYIHEYHDEFRGDRQDIVFIVSSSTDTFELRVRISDALRNEIETQDELENFIWRNCFRNNYRFIERRDDIEYVEVSKKPIRG